MVYSQTWDRFDLADVKGTPAGMKWRIEPAAGEKLAALKAKSGYRVKAILPPDMPEGRFSGSLAFSVKPPDGKGQPREERLRVDGRVEGRLSIAGARFGDDRALHMGVLKQGGHALQALLLRVNDARRSLAVRAIETTPDFLRVRVVPLGGESGKAGLYRIDVEIRNAPPCSFAGSDAGQR